MRLTVTSDDPQKAALIANTLISVLIEQNEQLQSVRYETTDQNLQARADEALKTIDLLQNEMDDISDEILQEQIEKVTSEISSLKNEVTDLEIKIAGIDPLTATSDEVSELIQYQAELNQKQPTLDLYQEIYTQLVVMEEPIRNENVSTTQIDRIQRTLSLYEQIYFSSISALEELNLARVQSAPNVIQVEPANPPGAPFTPQPYRTAFMYAIIGLFIAGSIVFFIEYLDDTIKTPEDVKQVLGLPVIGLIAEMKQLKMISLTI